MATFSEIMADKNKLEELKSALKEAEQDYQKVAPIAAEAGYPIENTKAFEISQKIEALERKLAGNDQF